ncbi:5408_t:CDS:2, partial [Gigaspora rosea]
RKNKNEENDLIKSSDEWKTLIKNGGLVENIDPQLPLPDTSTTTVTLPDTATIMSLSQTPRRKRKRVQANDLGVNTANESTAPSSNNDFEENTDPQSPPQDLNQFRQDLNLANHQIQQQQRW